jgi:hypothetical protein
MIGHTAESHKLIRNKQKVNCDSYHHPSEKIAQLEKFKHFISKGEILEVFAGKGNLTEWYKIQGNVTPMTKEEFGNSFDAIYKLRGSRKTYNVIDIDSYGYPDRFFPVVFELMKDKCLLIITFPIVGINALNGITEQHFITFWRSSRPTIGDITGILTDMAMREWRILSLVDIEKIKRIWRIIYTCKRFKATEICNVRNR